MSSISVYHVNMLKPYQQRTEKINLLCLEDDKKLEDERDMPNLELDHDAPEWSKSISDIQQLFQQCYSNFNKKNFCVNIVTFFSSNPGCTDLTERDIGLESDRPIVAKPYRMSPRQIDVLIL